MSWQNDTHVKHDNVAQDTVIDHLHEHVEETFAAIFTSRDSFEKWLSAFDVEQQDLLRTKAVFVKGADLPNAIHVQTLDLKNDAHSDEMSLYDEIFMPDQDTEYVVLFEPITICVICKYIIGLIISCLFYDYVYLPGKQHIVAWWNERTVGSCGHLQFERNLSNTTSCPYSPWCLGSWQRVINGYGSYVECECECGALWYCSAP